MPIREYQCEDCEAEFEELVQHSTPDEEIPCPECGQHRARRQLSAFSARSGGGGGVSRSSSSCGSSSSGFS